MSSRLPEQLAGFLAGAGYGPQALFSCNGVATLEVMRHLHRRAEHPFHNLGLVALDDLDWYPLVGGGITALAQPTERIGAAAFQCLLGVCKVVDCPPGAWTFVLNSSFEVPADPLTEKQRGLRVALFYLK